jgi:hypothetical protein
MRILLCPGRGAALFMPLRCVRSTQTLVVMAGLVPAIHVLLRHQKERRWMPGTSPGMTVFAK